MIRHVIRTVMLGAAVIVLCASAEAKGRFVYALNEPEAASGQVHAYAVSGSGRLREIAGSPFATGGVGSITSFVGLTRVVVVGDRLYAANSGAGTISAFDIDPTTGALSAVPGMPFPTPSGAAIAGASLTATSDGRFLFVGNAQEGIVDGLAIDEDGSLHPIEGSHFSASTPIHNIRATPDGRFLFISVPALYESGQLFVVGIDPCGVLYGPPAPQVQTTPATQFIFPTGFAFSCTTRRAFVSILSAGTTIDLFHIERDGQVTAVPGSPFAPQVGSVSDSPVLTPDEKYLFVASANSRGITAMAVSDDKSLSLVPGSPFVADELFAPTMLSIDERGRILYAVDFSTRKLQALKVAGDGSVSLGAGATTVVGESGFTFSIASYPAPLCAMPKPVLELRDDASGDLFTIDVDPENANFGVWTYQRQSTGETISGRADQVRVVSGATVIAKDTDFSAENPTFKMSASVDLVTGRATVKVSARGGGTRLKLTDADTRDNDGCP